MGTYPRGDKRWKKIPARGVCPDNGIPLWQALNPFTLKLDVDSKLALYQLIAEVNPTTSSFVKKINGGTYYLPIREGLAKKQVEKFRTLAYFTLPQQVRDTLPETVKNKYGGNKKRYPLKRAVMPFCIDDKGLFELYKLSHETPELRRCMKIIRVDGKVRQFVPRGLVYHFRKLLYQALPEEAKAGIPEGVKRKYARAGGLETLID